MPFQRIVPADFRREIEKQESAEFPLCFLTLHHPQIFPSIRVVSDPEDFMLDGNLHQGFEFELAMFTDNEGYPRARLSVQNVDLIIGDAVRNAIDAVRVDADIIAASQFDLSVFPRVALDDPVIRVKRIRHAILFNVEGDSVFLSGEIRNKDWTQETYPGMRATQARTPGLFW